MKLAAVVYDQRQQWDMMNQMEFKAVDGSRSTASRTFGEVLRGTFLDAGPRMKHLAFEEESEWRVVLLHGKRNSPQVKHRPGRSMLVPYVSVRLGTKERPMPIQEIIIGPNPHPDLDSEAVKGLCRQCGMNIEVRNSRIPYRAF